jgi:hypothetical protein
MTRYDERRECYDQPRSMDGLDQVEMDERPANHPDELFDLRIGLGARDDHAPELDPEAGDQ